ncbi:hypothetical protein [Paludisphaera mucosa]|uniref:Uncharacterized protein n=1 Tax=Paludisphaera mucosa TaxID=3030827 RepID=A0ABT6F611_9BACT|nr:hypothetical protein [Paludisphaera mucosa]MDG3002863.1 hypothetical protein [Paludisphaera mucosa]
MPRKHPPADYIPPVKPSAAAPDPESATPKVASGRPADQRPIRLLASSTRQSLGPLIERAAVTAKVCGCASQMQPGTLVTC